jgi:anaerobic magnesium-protoporphyrin IX monomethyl ester cyclase
MARVLFITQDSAYPQMGVLYLVDALRKKGIDSEIVASGLSSEDLDAVVAAFRPDVVGMSVLTAPQVIDFENHSIFLKENYPNVKVVWGGNHPTLLTELCLASPYIDHVFVGQGEIVFPQLVADLVEGRAGIPRKIEGHGPSRLDDFEPAWDKDDITRYLFSERHSVRSPDTRVKNIISQSVAQIQKIVGRTGANGETDATIRETIAALRKWDVGLYETDKNLFYYLLTSRGCPYKCTFCSEPLQVMHGDGAGKFLWNAHSVEWVRKQVETIRTMLARSGHCLDGIGIWDDMFWIRYKSNPRAFDVLDYLAQEKLGYLIEARADQLLANDFMVFRKLSETGCIQVFVGAESISQETLNYMKKGTKAVEYKRLIEYANRFHVALRMSFIIGFPGETDASVNATLDFCDAVNDGAYGPWVNISGPKIFTPYPGTEEYSRAVAAGFKAPTTHAEWGHINRSTEEYLRHFPWMRRNYSTRTLGRLERIFGNGYKALVAH